MCEYCSQDNDQDSLAGSDGVLYDKNKNKHFLYIEHFRNEKYFLEVNFCPECGNKLQ